MPDVLGQALALPGLVWMLVTVCVAGLIRERVIASCFGADFYGLPRSERTIELVREPVDVPAELPFGDETVVPLRAGGQVRWRLRS